MPIVSSIIYRTGLWVHIVTAMNPFSSITGYDRSKSGVELILNYC